jgi:TatD DNase family protein
MDNGFYISFGKYYAQSRIGISFTSIPNNRFFLETDTVEETIREVYTLAAKYKNITVTENKEIKNNLAAVLNRMLSTEFSITKF